MAKPVVLYGICGEGFGHSVRAKSLIERLEDKAVVHVLSSHDGYDFFARLNYPRLHRIDGILFAKRGHSIDWPASAWRCANFIMRGKDHLSRVTGIWDTIRPDLALSDFEPLVPRIALRKGVPVLAIDNQAKLSKCKLLGLPAGLRFYQSIVAPLVDWLVPFQVPRVVSCFHPEFCLPARPVRAIIGPMLRNSITRLKPTDGGFALIYYQEEVGKDLLRVARIIGMRTIVFGGCGHSRDYPEFEFHPHGAGFEESLAACTILIGPAGNQLLGEARFLGKKTICIPIRGQHEQAINAFYMEKSGLGIALKNISRMESQLAEFLKIPGPSPKPSDGAQCVADLVHAMPPFGFDSSDP